MTNSKLNIQVSGGNVNFGKIVQGDTNTVHVAEAKQVLDKEKPKAGLASSDHAQHTNVDATVANTGHAPVTQKKYKVSD